MTDAREPSLESRSLEAAREAAWQAYENEFHRYDGLEDMLESQRAWLAGAEWGIAAASEVLAELVRDAPSNVFVQDEIGARMDASQRAYKRGLEAALSALESLGAPK